MRSKLFPKPNQLVTVVENETKRKWVGQIVVYTPSLIVIKAKKLLSFDARKVHLK